MADTTRPAANSTSASSPKPKLDSKLTYSIYDNGPDPYVVANRLGMRVIPLMSGQNANQAK